MSEFSRLYTEKFEEGEVKLTAACIEMENAIIVFLNLKGRSRLGTLAVALPRGLRTETTSSVLLGEKYAVAAKILAMTFAKAFNKIALLSVNLEPLSDKELWPALSKLAKKIIERRNKNE